MRDQMAKRDIPARHPFVQNGAAEQPDRVRPQRLTAHLVGQGRAVIQAGQLIRVVYAHFVQHRVGREIDHLHGDGAGMGRERLWQIGNRGRNQRQKIGIGGGQAVGEGCVTHALGLARAQRL